MKKEKSSLRIYTVNITRYVIDSEIVEKHGNKNYRLLEHMGLPCPCALDVFIKTIADNYVHEEDRSSFIKHFDRKGLLVAYSSGKIEHIIDYRTVNTKGKEILVRHSILLVEDPISRDIIAVCCSADISALSIEEKKLTLVHEHLEQNIQVVDALTQEYDTIWLVDGNNLEMHLFKINGGSVFTEAVEMAMKKLYYDDALIAYADRYIAAEDRERVKKQATSEAIIKYLRKNNIFTANYLRQDENGNTNYHQMIFAKNSSADKNDIYVVAFKNVDAAAKEEMEKVVRAERIKQYEQDNKSMNLILESLGSSSWSIDLNEDYEIVRVHWSDNFRRVLGFKNEEDFPDEIESWSDLLYGDDKEKTLQLFNDAIYDLTGEKVFDIDFRMYTSKAGVRWFHAAGRLSRREDGSPITFVGLFKDVDEQKQKEAKLQEQLEIVEALSRDYRDIYKINLSARSAKAVKVEGNILGGALANIYTEYSYDALLRAFIKEKVYEDDAKITYDAMNIENVKEKLKDLDEYVSSYRSVDKGEIHYYQFKFLRMYGKENRDEIIVGFKNIDAVVNAEREREHLIAKSETDLMTSLLNKRSGEEKTRNLMYMGGVFIIIDIDHFKQFNDMFGHSVGDLVIVAVAQSIRETFRGADIAYRLGGDEFAIFAPRVNSREISQKIIRRFLKILLSKSIKEIGDKMISVSIGARIIEENSDITFEELYKTTDACTYKSKNEEGNHVTYYNAGL